MLRTIEIIKEQIKAIQSESQESRKSEVQELRELVEFINYDREILLSENQRLTKINEENPWKAKYMSLQDELKKEKNKTAELVKRIEELEDILYSSNLNRSCMEIGSFTDRPKKHNQSLSKNSERISVSSIKAGNIKKVNTFSNKSPFKPPKGGDRSPIIPNKNMNKATVEIKNNLAKAIDEAHKTLFVTFSQSKNRSISPCLSSKSSRYSTPPNGMFVNLSLLSNN